MPADRIAINHDGEVIVHAGRGSAAGDYDTLCGVDGDDEAIGTSIVPVPLNGRARITCDHCYAICRTAWRYSTKDFANNAR